MIAGSGDALRPGLPRLAGMALVGVAAAWGISFVVIKDAVAGMPTADLVGYRFGVAAVALLLLRPRTLMIIRGRTLTTGAILGVLLGLGFLLCTQGMRTTSVVASAFIVGTTVVFVPLVAWLWFRRRPGRRTAAAILMAVTGLAVLTLRGTEVGSGALLILTAALLWAVHLCALERWVPPDQVYGSALVQMGTAAVLAVAVGGAGGSAVQLPEPGSTGSVLYLGAIATAAAFVALTWAQTRTDATTTAVLLTLEPVIGAAAAIAIGERLTAGAVIGATLVLAATGLLVIRRAPLSRLRAAVTQPVGPADRQTVGSTVCQPVRPLAWQPVRWATDQARTVHRPGCRPPTRRAA